VTPGTRRVQRNREQADGVRMLDRIPRRLLVARPDGRVAAVVVGAVRLAAGAFLVGVGLGKFTDHASELADFRHYGVPFPELAVPLAGVIEVVGGACVVVGFLIRPAAALVALNLLGALLTAGLTDGGTFHLVVGPVVMVAMLVLVVTGAPAPSVDASVVSRRSPRSIRR
jgi:putative oxidoreductase